MQEPLRVLNDFENQVSVLSSNFENISIRLAGVVLNVEKIHFKVKKSNFTASDGAISLRKVFSISEMKKNRFP